MATTRTSGANVSGVYRGRNGTISCTATGVPVPTISWTFNNQTTRFNQQDSSSVHSVFVRSVGEGIVITPGQIVSTLLIENAQYPSDEGFYVCVGTNSEFGTNSAMINLEVLGISKSHNCLYTYNIMWPLSA